MDQLWNLIASAPVCCIILLVLSLTVGFLINGLEKFPLSMSIITFGSFLLWFFPLPLGENYFSQLLATFLCYLGLSTLLGLTITFVVYLYFKVKKLKKQEI